MDPAIIAEFFAEGNEHLETLETCLLRLESDPSDKDAIDRSFRAVHSIKGACGFLELHALEKLTHTAEDLLDLLRQGKLRCNSAITGVLLKVSDQGKSLLIAAKEGTDVPLNAVEPMVESLKAAMTTPPPAAAPPPAAPPAAPPPALEPPRPTPSLPAGPALLSRAPRVPRLATPPDTGLTASALAPGPAPVAAPVIPAPAPVIPAPAPVAAPVIPTPAPIAPAPAPVIPTPAPVAAPTPAPVAAPSSGISLAPQVAGDPFALPSIPGAPALVARAPRRTASTPPPAAPPSGENQQKPASDTGGTPTGEAASKQNRANDSSAPTAPPTSTAEAPFARRRSNDNEDTNSGTVRVDITLLDDIMNLVGELVVARNRLVQLVADRDDRVLAQAGRRVDHLTSDLQGRVMKTRMRPVAMAWGPIPRLVRDVATATGKMVTVETKGQDTELDRNLLEILKDPLAHIIRNCVDHGLETPEARVAAGKSPMGTILLQSRHSEGQVHIEVSDDGRGIQVEKVRARALANGLITREEAASAPDESLLALIFQPGFSTAESVSKLSGRGVGMDVVKSSVERVGGSVDIRSTPGKGTNIRMRLPLTLAIMPALITLVHGKRFCIPQNNLIEIVDLMTKESQKQVEWLSDAPLLRLRGQLLPLVPLSTLLRFEKAKKNLTGYVVVVEADDLRFGIVVDDIQHTEEIVIKPVGVEIKRAQIYSGATVLGDGSVALIFDVGALGRQGKIGARPAVRASQNTSARGENRTLLRVEVEGLGMVAVDVHHVVRVDEGSAVSTFRHGNSILFRYQEQVVPLHLLYPGNWSQIVVCERGQALIGLAVQSVLDVVSDTVEINASLGEAWAEGVAFLNGQPTAIVDINRLQFGRGA